MEKEPEYRKFFRSRELHPVEKLKNGLSRERSR